MLGDFGLIAILFFTYSLRSILNFSNLGSDLKDAFNIFIRVMPLKTKSSLVMEREWLVGRTLPRLSSFLSWNLFANYYGFLLLSVC